MGRAPVSLEEFGLSKYEAQAYVALIARGTIPASELAYYSEIPRTKIYPTLSKLESKRLVVVSKGRPMTCTAAAPEDAFDGIIHEQIDKVNAMNSLVSDLKKASEASRKSRGSEEKRYFHMGANSVLGHLRAMAEGAKSSARIMADQWGMGLVSECREQIRAASRRGVDVRVLIPPSQIGSEAYRSIPEGADVRASEVSQNCFVFDETEVLIVDGGNGRGAAFSSAGMLGAGQARVFAGIWKGATRTRALADMTKAEAQEVYRMVRTVGEAGLPHMLGSAMSPRGGDPGIAKLLESSGISLKRPLDDIIAMLDAAVQITCSGRVVFEAGARSITVESRVNSGHSLPWVAVLNDCLRRQGYKTRTAYQNGGKGEKTHIRISKN